MGFYPLLSKDTFERALVFAQTYIAVTEPMKNAILNSRKAFLYFKDDPWIENMASHIAAHNRKVLKIANPNPTDERRCNCENPENCPLDHGLLEISQVGHGWMEIA